MERKIVEFSEGEFMIRSYQCTLQKSAFSKTSNGYLQVTNKRVIYANSTKSGASTTFLVSEVPLEDVGSISSFIGNSRNLLGILPFVILLTGISIFSGEILPEFMTHWLFAFLLMLPFIVIWLMEKNILNQELFDQVLKNLEIEIDAHKAIGKPGDTLRKVLRIIFLIGLVLLVAGVMNNTSLGNSLGFLRFVIPLIVFGLVYVSLLGFQDEFGLFISSRSASGSGLTIKSNGFLSLHGKNSFASPGKIIPAVDSVTVAKELGALVMDLQQAGDLAVEKWSLRPTTFADSD